MSLRLKAIDASLPQLIAVLRRNSDLLVSLREACQECGIQIGQPEGGHKTKNEKVLYFVHGLLTELVSEDSKRKSFIRVLKSHQAFHSIYKEIKRSIKEYKNEEKRLCIPLEETGDAGACKSTTIVTEHCGFLRLRCHTDSEDLYHEEMDRNQYIAVINDLQDRMRNLEEERKIAQVGKETAFQKRSELEQKLDSVANELTSTKTERDALECRNKFLQGKVAKLEKNRYLDSHKTKESCNVYQKN